MCLPAYSGVASSIPARSRTFMKIDYGIILRSFSFLPLMHLNEEGLLSITSVRMCTNYWLTACSSLPRKKCGYVNCHRPAMTITVDWEVKQQNKQNCLQLG